jgi:hypothetical protein
MVSNSEVVALLLHISPQYPEGLPEIVEATTEVVGP